MEPFHIEKDLANVLQGMKDDELEDFAKTYEDATNDVDIELFIYTCVLLFQRTGSLEHLDRGVQQAEGWVVITSDDDPQKARRCEIWNKVIAIQAGAREDTKADGETNRGRDLARLLEAQDEESLRHAIHTAQGRILGIIPDDHAIRLNLQAFSLLHDQLFQKTGNLDDLDRAAEFLQEIAAATFDDVPKQAECLRGHSYLLGVRFKQTQAIDDLNQSISSSDIAEAIDPSSGDQVDIDRARFLVQLSTRFISRFDISSEVGDIDRAISAAKSALGHATPDSSTQDGHLRHLAMALETRFDHTKAVEDLEPLLEVYKRILDINSDAADRPKILRKIGSLFNSRFDQAGTVEDLNGAVEHFALADQAPSPIEPLEQGSCKHLLALALWKRFEKTGEKADLDDAIETCEKALAASPDHPATLEALKSLGMWLKTRYDNNKAIGDLDRALEVTELSLASAPSDEREQLFLLNNINSLLSVRYNCRPNQHDVERGVQVSELATEIYPENPRKFVFLRYLGLWLQRRDGENSMSTARDLDLAIEYLEMAFDKIPSDEPNRTKVESFSNLSSALFRRFQRSRNIDDISHVTKMAEEIENTTRLDQDGMGELLHIKAMADSARFVQYGTAEELKKAIESAEGAIAILPPGNLDIFSWLTSAATLLVEQFARTGSTADLKRAIDLAQRAVDEAPDDYENRDSLLSNVALTLGKKWERTRELEYLVKAIELDEMALAIPRRGHEVQAPRLKLNLGVHLTSLGEQTRERDPLDRAIKHLNETLASIPPDGFYRYRVLLTLSRSHASLFGQTNNPEHLQDAIDATTKAMEATPLGHPERGKALYRAGLNFAKLYRATSDRKALDRAIAFFEEGWNFQAGLPMIRLECARIAGDLLAEESQWERSSSFLEGAVNLLPKLSPRSLKSEDKQYLLSTIPGLASLAPAVALNAGKKPEEALNLVELGRGVIAGLLLEMRTDISDLRDEDDELATEFMSIRDQLDSAGDELAELSSAPSWDLNAKSRRRLELDRQYDEVIGKIRHLEKFRRFLLPPSKEELIKASIPGPIVVINVCRHRCDALIIDHRALLTGGDPIMVWNLPALTEEKIKENVDHLRVFGITSSILEWLWDAAASPVLEKLGFQQPPSDDDNWHHMWWILTSSLSHLPIHAAGYHGTGSTVLDRVISSYSPSVKALIYGRRNHPLKQKSPAKDSEERPAEEEAQQGRDLDESILHKGHLGKPGLDTGPSKLALLVAMEETPGPASNSKLEHAREEVEMLARMCREIQLEPLEPTQTRDEVLKQITKCKLFHFAGHGKTDHAEPSQSCLLLKDWPSKPLTVADLRDSRLQKNTPFLAYLSACSTSVNQVDNLVDEGIHLVNAFQLAGFRHVVGTLWSVSDRHCVEVARIFYETIRKEGMKDEAVYRGLHRAVRALRDGFMKQAEPAQPNKFPPIAKVDNGQAEDTALSSTQGNKAAAVVGGGNEKARAENERQVPNGGNNDEKRGGRDAKLVDFDLLIPAAWHIRYWAPYIHVGV